MRTNNYKFITREIFRQFDLFILGRDVLEEVQKLLLPILIYVFDKLFVNFNSEVKPEPLDDNTEEFLPF